jgi:hypothetical protein
LRRPAPAVSGAFHALHHALFHCRQQASIRIRTSQLPLTRPEEFEMELLIGFVTTLFISLLIFRT